MIRGTCHCGAIHWEFDGVPDSATACNCTMCRRYGSLWAYGHEGGNITVAGQSRTYSHGERNLDVHFCPTCGTVAYWRATQAEPDGRRRIGVNLRLAHPHEVAQIPVTHFDGLDTWSVVSGGALCVADLWF